MNVTADLRYAIRAIGKMRGTAAIAIATLAIGIAATTTMFSVVYATLYRPLPFFEPERLIALYVVRQTPRTGTVEVRWPLAKIAALKSATQSFDALGNYTQASVSVAAAPGAQQVDAEMISASYVRALRVPIAAGRAFLDEEDAPGHAVALITVDLWRRSFGDADFVPGRTLVVNAVPLAIVGLLPDDFHGLSGRAQLWIPYGMAPQLTYREYLTTPQHFINVIGRLKPDVSLAAANAELAAIGPHLPNTPNDSDEPTTWSALARQLNDARVEPGNRRSALILFSAVACLLLVTCINVAGLLMTRARVRRREIAIRVAMGAGRWRIVRQLLTETGVLAVAGGALGTLLAAWSIAWFRQFAPGNAGAIHTGYFPIASFATPALDAAGLICAAGLTLACALIAGLVPAMQSGKADPIVALTESTRASTSAGVGRTLHVLASAQVALAVLIVAGALLLLATFVRLQQTRAGFDGSQVLVFWTMPPGSRYAPEDGPRVIERMLDSVRAVPGVSLAAVNRCTPFSASCARTIVFFPGRPSSPELAPVVGRHYVSSDYFRALGIRVLAGRVLTDADRAGRPPVAVINETAARRFWPGEDPIGKHVWFGSATGFTDPAHPVEIVGVVADVKYWPINEPAGLDFYTSYLQFAYPDTAVIVKGSGDAAALVPALRTAVASVDRSIPIYDARLLHDRVADALARPRFNATGMGVFAALTAMLAAMGVFGVISAGVTARTRELAIRLALGSTTMGLRRLILGEALQIALLGSGVGLLAAVLGLRALRGALFGVTPFDPLLLGGSIGVMAVVALGAALWPANRASATDPMVALRVE